MGGQGGQPGERKGVRTDTRGRGADQAVLGVQTGSQKVAFCLVSVSEGNLPGGGSGESPAGRRPEGCAEVQTVKGRVSALVRVW